MITLGKIVCTFNNYLTYICTAMLFLFDYETCKGSLDHDHLDSADLDLHGDLDLGLTLMALRTLTRLVRMVMRSLLKRTISCTSTVFMLWVYDVGYLRSADSVSKSFGSLLMMSDATSSMTSSLDFPPAAAAFACQNATFVVSNRVRSPQAYPCVNYLHVTPI